MAGVIAQPARQQEADLGFMLSLAATSCVCAIAQTGECGQSKHEDEVSFLLPGRLYNHTSHLYIPVKVPAVLLVGSQGQMQVTNAASQGPRSCLCLMFVVMQ